MTYSNNYSIIDIHYDEHTRLTAVRICCEDTGEVFEGHATRNPKDEMNIATGANVALIRAIHEMVKTNLKDDLFNLVEYGELPFEHC